MSVETTTQASTGWPVRLATRLWQVAGPGVTHPWDAAAYLVTGHRTALVDCGTGLAGPLLDAAVGRACAVDDAPAPTTLVLTHGHYDHAGDAHRLRRRGLRVLAGAGDVDALATGDPVRTCAGPLYGRAFRPVEAEPLDADRTLDLGGVRLDLLLTPGHTPGSVCAVARTPDGAALLAGDTLWGHFSTEVGSDAAAWKASLERLAGLDVDTLTFGHGVDRLLGDPAGRLAEALARFGTYYDPWFRPPRLTFVY